MIRRPTWILLAVFIGFLGAAWYWQKYQGKKVEAEPSPTPQTLLPDLNISTIREIKIDDSKGKQLFLQNISTGIWIMTQPERQAVDVEALTTKIQQLTYLTALSTLKTPPPDDQIGLVTPAFVITLTNQDGKVTVLNIGALTPTQDGYYIRLDSKTYVVSKTDIDAVTDMLANPPILTPTTTPTVAGSSTEIITGTATSQPETVTATP